MVWFYIIISIYYIFGFIYYLILNYFNINVKTIMVDSIDDTLELNPLEEQFL